MEIDWRQVSVSTLSDDTPGIRTFKNRIGSMAKYLREEALPDQRRRIGVTKTFVYGDTILGFVTLATASVKSRDVEGRGKWLRFGEVPALLIGQLATHLEYEGRHVGRTLVNLAVAEAVDLSRRVGCRLVVLHPRKDAISWYESQNFKMSSTQNLMYLDIGSDYG